MKFSGGPGSGGLRSGSNDPFSNDSLRDEILLYCVGAAAGKICRAFVVIRGAVDVEDDRWFLFEQGYSQFETLASRPGETILVGFEFYRLGSEEFRQTFFKAHSVGRRWRGWRWRRWRRYLKTHLFHSFEARNQKAALLGHDGSSLGAGDDNSAAIRL